MNCWLYVVILPPCLMVTTVGSLKLLVNPYSGVVPLWLASESAFGETVLECELNAI